MQQRVDELETLEDDSMDEDAHDGTEEWTPGELHVNTLTHRLYFAGSNKISTDTPST